MNIKRLLLATASAFAMSLFTGGSAQADCERGTLDER